MVLKKYICHRRSALLCAVALALAAGSAMAGPRFPIHKYHLSPQAGPVFQEWTANSLAHMASYDLGDFTPFMSDEAWTTAMLADPSFIYSDLHPNLFIPRDMVGLPMAVNKRRALAWDLGLDKALPFYQTLMGDAQPDARSELAPVHVAIRPHLIKAGVRRSYFDRAYQLGGQAQVSALAAGLAVAAEILRERVAATPADQRMNLDVRVDVLRRFETAEDTDTLSAEDLDYLKDILRYELSVFRAGRNNIYGIRELPTALRIARVAAAYKLRQAGGAADPCLSDGSHRPVVAGTDPTNLSWPICFPDATDRAVYQWYLTEREWQLASMEDPNVCLHEGCRTMVTFFGHIMPAWVGVHHDAVLKHANRVEVLEAQMAMDAPSDNPGEFAFLRLVHRAQAVIYPGVHP